MEVRLVFSTAISLIAIYIFSELTTHTLLLEKGLLGGSVAILVGSGPLTNIDPTARDPASGHSQIRRFILPHPPTPTSVFPTVHWADGKVIVYGIRNPAGFDFPTGSTIFSRSIYVAENGASIDSVTGLTAAFVNDNPADDLEFVTYSTSPSPHLAIPPKFHGFPDCSTLWNPTADPVGVPQYTTLAKGAQFSLNLDPARDDNWCRSVANSQPPAFSFQVSLLYAPIL